MATDVGCELQDARTGSNDEQVCWWRRDGSEKGKEGEEEEEEEAKKKRGEQKGRDEGAAQCNTGLRPHQLKHAPGRGGHVELAAPVDYT